jgi:hypothetical protein
MNQQSENSQDQSHINQEFAAKLTISVDKQGLVEYNCDWDNTTDGLASVASIFYQLMFDELPDAILSEIKQECVLNGNEQNYLHIINLISSFVIDNQKEVSPEEDEVVVQPDQVFHL